VSAGGPFLVSVTVTTLATSREGTRIIATQIKARPETIDDLIAYLADHPSSLDLARQLQHLEVIRHPTDGLLARIAS
jgi:hypothetical protein